MFVARAKSDSWDPVKNNGAPGTENQRTFFKHLKVGISLIFSVRFPTTVLGGFIG